VSAVGPLLQVGADSAGGLHPIKVVYVGVLICTTLFLFGMNYWVQTRASTSRIRTVVVHHNASILWALVAALGLLVERQQATLWLVYLRTGLAYAVAILFVRFATIYSGRSTSLKRPFNAVFVGGMTVGLIGLITQPWLGLHFDPFVYHLEPFPYYETGFGPLWQLSLLWSYIGISVGLYYLVELFFTSQHRSSRPLVVYIVGVLLALIPSLLTATAHIPTLPGYDHSVFGLSIASVAFFLGAWQGMVKISPISRDKLLAKTEDGLVVIDGSGQIVDHNIVATQFFEEPETNYIGRSLASVSPVLSETVPEEAMVSADDGTEGEPVETKSGNQRVEFPAHGDRRYSMVVSPVMNMDAVAGYALLIRDVTERYENRQELQRQNRQLDDFASSISHYLRNPLQIAGGQTELARQRLAANNRSEPANQKRLDELDRSLDRMETIITDLRTLAKQGKSVEATESLTFGAVVRSAQNHVEIGGATVTVERDGILQADQSRLLSILENLIRNSIEHGETSNDPTTSDSGAHAGSAIEMTLWLTEDGFVFEDNGSGFGGDHDRLFEYGYTTSADGTGLGLSIVRTMAESHGWQVHIDTDHDGARFVFTGAVTAVDAGPAVEPEN